MTHKNSFRIFFVPALLSLLCLINFAVGHAAPVEKTMSIAAERTLPLGTVVTIDGVVTVPSGAFSSSTFDQGFGVRLVILRHHPALLCQ